MYVKTREESVTIVTDEGTEVAHWTADEWEENPALAPTIANAVRLAHVDPGELIRRLYSEDFGSAVERGPDHLRVDEEPLTR